jgi:hypothetical protein
VVFSWFYFLEKATFTKKKEKRGRRRKMSISNRREQFMQFEILVGDHIDNYTVPQYGDAPDDEVERWSTEQCVLAIQKYTKRFDSPRRGRIETLRDMVKIAHFACIAFYKMKPTIEEEDAISEGRR